MAEVALDANVVVGFLDANDSLHARAAALLRDLEEKGHGVVLLDVLCWRGPVRAVQESP